MHQSMVEIWINPKDAATKYVVSLGGLNYIQILYCPSTNLQLETVNNSYPSGHGAFRSP